MTITIGQRLRTAREDRHLTLEQVFESTRIRVQYLQALEEDDLSVMPSPVQARGYLRNYAEFLGIDVGKLLEELHESSVQKPADEVIGPMDVPEAQETPAPEPSSPEAPSVEEPSPLIKPKPARRKKADSQPGGDSAPTTKRHRRKIEDLDLEIQIEPPVVLQAEGAGQVKSADDETLPIEDESPRPYTPLHKDGMESFLESARQIQESVPANVPRTLDESPAMKETSSEQDVNDNLWQTWLTRLGAVLAARNRRQTLVVKEPAIPEDTFVSDGAPSTLQGHAPEGTKAAAHQESEGSTQIFKEIGRQLRERRELLSLHLEEVEHNTHVKAHYLDALERGAMDELPSTVQTRGMLSNYATFLDLDVDALLLRFADALQARYRERNPQQPVRKPGQPIIASLPPMRSFIAGDLIFGVGIVVLLVGFAIWGVSRVLTLQSQQEVDPTAPSISDILLAPPDASPVTTTATLKPFESFPGEATVTVVIPTLNANVNVQVNLIAAERTYMRVIVDGEVVFEGRVVPGTAYPFEAEDQVEVLAGSGAAIRVVYNGRDMGLLGSIGQVVSNIYRAGEIITPTGLPTATETFTPTPTNTVPPTATLRFTATPAPSNTAVP